MDLRRIELRFKHFIRVLRQPAAQGPHLARRELNPRPEVYKTSALTTELRADDF